MGTWDLVSALLGVVNIYINCLVANVPRVLAFIKSSLGKGLFYEKHGHIHISAYLDAGYSDAGYALDSYIVHKIPLCLVLFFPI